MLTNNKLAVFMYIIYILFTHILYCRTLFSCAEAEIKVGSFELRVQRKLPLIEPNCLPRAFSYCSATFRLGLFCQRKTQTTTCEIIERSEHTFIRCERYWCNCVTDETYKTNWNNTTCSSYKCKTWLVKWTKLKMGQGNEWTDMVNTNIRQFF